ncbi:MAG: hypothetical protein AAB493_01590 [Patescibacteria group bacterium]
MKKEVAQKTQKRFKRKHLYFVIISVLLLVVIFFVGMGFLNVKTISYDRENWLKISDKIPPIPPLDTVTYDKKLEELANNPPLKVVAPKFDPKTGEEILPLPTEPNLWPVKTVYPNAGAILPFNRIVAYYGNFYSTKMGALGQYKEEEMLNRLSAEVKKWTDADSTTPAIPALHYIAVVAQAGAGDDGQHRARMPEEEIKKALKMAEKINAIVFLDIQVGFSNLQTELPLLEKYFKMPNVHLGIDPEFSMKTGIRPGKVVGNYDATDINYAAEFLAKIVKENNLIPKIFIIHRYTKKMVTNYKEIKPLPEVQIVMDMDGWGGSAKKKNTYQYFIYKEPVQFTGFKLFYKNDTLEEGTVLMTPEEILKLQPKPIYIQYQ